MTLTSLVDWTNCNEWPRSVGVARWAWSIEQFRVSVAINRGDKIVIEMSEEQVVSAEVKPVTAKGNPATVDGEVVWSVSDGTVVSLEVDAADSKKATFTALAGDGARPCDVVAEFDADLGDGVRTITAIGQIVVKDAEAQTAEVVFGTPA
jgi:uncharacterized Zn finger protein